MSSPKEQLERIGRKYAAEIEIFEDFVRAVLNLKIPSISPKEGDKLGFTFAGEQWAIGFKFSDFAASEIGLSSESRSSVSIQIDQDGTLTNVKTKVLKLPGDSEIVFYTLLASRFKSQTTDASGRRLPVSPDF